MQTLGESFHTAAGLPLRLSFHPGPAALPPCCQVLLDSADAEMRRNGRRVGFLQLAEYSLPLVFGWYYKDPAGFVQYGPWSQRLGALVVTAAYVMPTLRGMGVYDAMHDGMAAKAHRKGAVRLHPTRLSPRRLHGGQPLLSPAAMR